MATLRWLLLAVLTVTIPVMGLAAVLPPETCPMQSQAQAGTQQKHGCCNDSADQHSDRGGSICKTGQTCPSNGASAIHAISIQLSIKPQTTSIVAVSDHREISNTSASVWRPPRV